MRSRSNVRGVSIAEVVESYWVFLAKNHYPAHLGRFRQRLASAPKAAEAEAVVFSFLWSERVRPDIFEDLSKGDPDFCCEPSGKTKFLVEVASLESGAVARRSELPERITGTGGGAFSLITPLLQGKATAKAAQLAKYSLPSVLAITASHDCAGLLMDRLAAEFFLISDPVLKVRLGDISDRGSQVTDLRRSVFFKPGKSGREIIPCRQSISAILLVAISGIQADVVGILHPEPSVAFAPALLPQVPYLRVKNWPISDGRIEVEWSTSDPDQATFWHTRIC